MSTTPRPWSFQEDTLLRNAVAQHGDGPGVWKLVSDSIPGRSNKACRKRWLHSLSPTIRKTPWTPVEDALLLKLYATHTPPRWSLIAKHIPGRTDDACSKRYREALDPLLKKDSWTPEEDAKLVQLTAQIGSKWTQVGQAMGRSGLGCRNRWRLLQRKQHSRDAARPTNTHDAVTGHQSPYNPQYRLTGLPSPPTPAYECPTTNISHSQYDEPVTGQPTSPSSSSSCLIHSPHPCNISTDSSHSSPLPSFILVRNPWPNSSDIAPIASDLPCTLSSTVPVTPHVDSLISCPTQVPTSPPMHPGADPGSATLAPNEARSSVSPRKWPWLRSSSPVSEHIRLSSRLPVDMNRTVLPYACGHPTCWEHSLARFATASELMGHRRLSHPKEKLAKLYKCALQGCGKSWKNINGIQYHLQISKAHFKDALCQTQAPSDVPATSSTEPHAMTESISETHTRKQKMFCCPHQGCTNSYKQRNGLRYHLAHGHPANVAQLNVIPPVLMLQLSRRSIRT